MKSVLLSCLAVLVVLVAGCEAKLGESCSGFFSNGCKAPSMCVDTGETKVCVTSCTMLTEPTIHQGCEDPNFEKIEVETDEGAAMGCYCAPKS